MIVLFVVMALGQTLPTNVWNPQTGTFVYDGGRGSVPPPGTFDLYAPFIYLQGIQVGDGGILMSLSSGGGGGGGVGNLDAGPSYYFANPSLFGGKVFIPNDVLSLDPNSANALTIGSNSVGQSGGVLVLGHSGAQVSIDNSGNMTAPGTITSTAGQIISSNQLCMAGSCAYRVQESSGNMSFYVASSDVMDLDNSGNLTIGGLSCNSVSTNQISLGTGDSITWADGPSMDTDGTGGFLFSFPEQLNIGGTSFSPTGSVFMNPGATITMGNDTVVLDNSGNNYLVSDGTNITLQSTAGFVALGSTTTAHDVLVDQTGDALVPGYVMADGGSFPAGKLTVGGVVVGQAHTLFSGSGLGAVIAASTTYAGHQNSEGAVTVTHITGYTSLAGTCTACGANVTYIVTDGTHNCMTSNIACTASGVFDTTVSGTCNFATNQALTLKTGAGACTTFPKVENIDVVGTP